MVSIALEDRLAEALRKSSELHPLVCQILDGWHNDGTAWSQWDETIRKRLIEYVQQADKLLAEYDRAKGGKE